MEDTFNGSPFQVGIPGVPDEASSDGDTREDITLEEQPGVVVTRAFLLGEIDKVTNDEAREWVGYEVERCCNEHARLVQLRRECEDEFVPLIREIPLYLISLAKVVAEYIRGYGGIQLDHICGNIVDEIRSPALYEFLGLDPERQNFTDKRFGALYSMFRNNYLDTDSFFESEEA